MVLCVFMATRFHAVHVIVLLVCSINLVLRLLLGTGILLVALVVERDILHAQNTTRSNSGFGDS